MRLEEEGIEILTAAMNLDPIRGKNGLVIKPDTLIGGLKADDLFGLVLPGGWAPDKLRRYKEATDLTAEMDKQGKTIGIICHGGLLAISAKIVKGKRLLVHSASRMTCSTLVLSGLTKPLSPMGTRFGGGAWSPISLP